MRHIPKERILRVNCAGYGTEAHWNLGRAKSLNDYSAIIVNPVSIAHLFDKDPELVRKVEQCLAEGNTTLTIDDDLLLRNLAAEIDSRVLELSDFLTSGGVLVYFLCRPFIIQGPSLALDNYYWLESLAPDQPAERNVRHMSAVSHGRLIEPTEDGTISEFAPYLQQPGLEWSTLIRTEFLTEGYSVMAEAGSKKCIAGQLFIVESSGKVVFLPSPYSPDFDKTLIDCLNGWYTLKEQSPEELEAEQNEARTYASMAAAEAPQTGSGLFEREQSQYEPVANAMVDTGSESFTHSGSFETASNNFANAAPTFESVSQVVEPEPGFTFNADKIAESVSQEAHRFEEEVASRVAREQKKPTTSIDLSIFAQTARQLVQKTTDTPAAAQDDDTTAPGVASGSFGTFTPQIEEAPAEQAPVVELAMDEPPTFAEEPTFESAFEELEPIAESPVPSNYSLPPENITTPPASGSSLRNLLSSVTPDLPQGVKPSLASPASALLSDSDSEETGGFPPVSEEAPTYQAKPKNAASLFRDDDDFDLADITRAEEPVQSAASEMARQADIDTSDQNSGVYSEQNALPESDTYDQPQVEPSGNSGAYGAPAFESSSVESDYYSDLETPNNNSGAYNQQQTESPSNNSEPYSQSVESPSNNSGAYGQPLDTIGTGSGDFNTVSNTPAATSNTFDHPQVEPAPEPSYNQSQLETPVAQPEPVPTLPPAAQELTPPPAEPAILEPPTGFMSNFATQNASRSVDHLESAELPMAQTPVPSVSPAGDNSAVTNNDPSNHENKSTMDLLRELEKAQRPPEQGRPQPAPGPAIAAPGQAQDGVRPLLNSLFKKDATDVAPLENAPPAIPPSAPPAVPHASTPPPPVPTRNTLGALMQPAESRVSVPQENLAMNREGSNAMSNMVVPDWCKQFSFSYLDELKKEQATLASELQDIQAKLNTVESKIASVEQLKAALLSGDGDSLKEATGLILGKLGWSININNAAPNEVLLLNVDQPEALVRIVRSEAHCDRSEVAQVSGSAIAFWEKHDIEPKGLLIACTWANSSPSNRNQKDFEEPVTEFAKKKNLCLITSIQMLGIYRDLELGLVTPDIVRRQMLETNGLLSGYAVEAVGSMVGARA